MLARGLSSFAKQSTANHTSGGHGSTLSQDRKHATERTQCHTRSQSSYSSEDSATLTSSFLAQF